MITETLYFWVVRSGFLMIKVQTDLDDSVVLAEHCDYIVKILSVILQPNIKTLEQDFTIDLRNFGNFQIKDDNLCSAGDLQEMGIKAGKQLVGECFYLFPRGHRGIHNRKPGHYENIRTICRFSHRRTKSGNFHSWDFHQGQVA